jgi:hypothetical protein
MFHYVIEQLRKFASHTKQINQLLKSTSRLLSKMGHRLREGVAKGTACRRRYGIRSAALLAEIAEQSCLRIVEWLARESHPADTTREAVGGRTAPLLCRSRAEDVAAESGLERRSSRPACHTVFSRSCSSEKARICELVHTRIRFTHGKRFFGPDRTARKPRPSALFNLGRKPDVRCRSR